MRSGFLAFFFLLAVSSSASFAQEVRIGVLGLFHPHELELRAVPTKALVITISGETFVLEPRSPNSDARIKISGHQMLVAIHGGEIRGVELHASGRNSACSFFLSVPGRVNRRYRGTLSITVKDGELSPVVAMDLETAVASVVQAESRPHTPDEALKSQAVVTRSYFVAGKGRHESFDFCDLAHCQVMRDDPAQGSPAVHAAEETAGLVLAYQGKPIAAMFTRSCGGRTRTPSELGMPVNGYPYFSVVCDYCHTSPFRWTRKLSREDAALLIAKGEAGRLAVDRRLGWNAVPSNNFTARPEGDEMILEGTGQGHGIGLCQRGAMDMATRGADFRQILDHYFPNATLIHVATSFGP
ncbi:MAG TPA: SpoIID/LytB domain-containing protein [Terriglobales bacterium]|nr:SpoIID/LytB domain-containing protein [Terriglobales bacterium]